MPPLLSPDELLQAAIIPAHELLGRERFDGRNARVLSLAIALQEGWDLKHRRQVGGPARGFWGFEEHGGVLGVLTHPASSSYARGICAMLGYEPDVEIVYGRLEHDDVLAAAFARLLLWTDPDPLPALGDGATAWNYYLRNWRPGKPHPEAWPPRYATAVSCVTR